jgi:hypothetical protein
MQGTARPGGGSFIITALAALIALVLGLGVGPWFTAHEVASEHTGLTAELVGGETEILLYRTAICANYATDCVAAPTVELVGGACGALAAATFVLGLGFGGLVGFAVHRRLAVGAASGGLVLLGLVLGAATLACALLCLVVVRPDALAVDIVHGYAHTYSLTSTPGLGWGGFVTVLGLGGGAVTLWRTRPVADPVAVEASPARRPPDAELRPPPPRGVETDPFRAPPSPPPLAVVRHARPATAPRAATEDGEPGPALRR